MSIVSTSPLDEATIRALVGFDAAGAPVTTAYLDVDGRRHPSHLDLERSVERRLRQARSSLNGLAADPGVQRDLRRIEDFVRAGFDRSSTRGLAFFACAEVGLFEVLALPVPVRDRVVVNAAPAVAQLEAVLRDHQPIGVLLADRQRARVLVFELGELTERTELLEELPRDYDIRGERERGTPDAHVDELTLMHVRHAAELTFKIHSARPFAHLVIGAQDPLAGELEAALHPYLTERLRGRVAVPVSAGLAAIRDAAAEAEHRIERERETTLVETLRAESASGRRGVTGLADTLAALNDHRVERLLVSDGYEEEGWRCPDTGALAAVGPTSPRTGAPMVRVPDVVEEAVDAAFGTGAQVTVCIGNADLDCLGRIGAILRY